MRDIYTHTAVVYAIPPATLDADNTPAAVDLLGFNSAMLAIEVGVGGITFSGTNKVEFKLTHSIDDSTYDAVTDADVQLADGDAVLSGGIVHRLVAAHAAATIKRIGYIGNRRFLKLLADFGGTHGAGTPISATVIKGRPAQAPVS